MISGDLKYDHDTQPECSSSVCCCKTNGQVWQVCCGNILGLDGESYRGQASPRTTTQCMCLPQEVVQT